MEAVIETASGTRIRVKGSRKDVARVLALFVDGAPVGAPTDGETTNGATQAAASPVPGAHRDPTSRLDGIAERDAHGNVHLIAPDLKARNALDAARRLIYLGLLARRALLNESKTPRSVIVSLLRSYGLYDGNVRRLVPADPHLVKEGRRFVSLAESALPAAWGYAREVQDATRRGVWQPRAARTAEAR